MLLPRQETAAAAAPVAAAESARLQSEIGKREKIKNWHVLTTLHHLFGKAPLLWRVSGKLLFSLILSFLGQTPITLKATINGFRSPDK